MKICEYVIKFYLFFLRYNASFSTIIYRIHTFIYMYIFLEIGGVIRPLKAANLTFNTPIK